MRINKRYFETARFTGVFLTVMLAATPLAQPAAAAQPNRQPAGSRISKQHVAASLTQRAAEGTPATEPAARLLDSNRPAHTAAATQQAYLKASNAEAYDVFGSSVAVDGDTM
ncbi:MAG: FG-GAP repeat protein, partial [Chloroflexi bacterium]|nr:FG-GAP repeat protein [Chloroflexota bacterium]